jgi:ligand-binding sensor domain-containing protein
MKVSPYNSNYMWAGTLSHIFRSTNQGLHWTISNMPVTGNVVGIAVGNNDSTVYGVIAGLTSDSNGHFVKSTNGGLNWIKAATNFPMTPVNSLARATSGQLFVGTDYGVITSTDDGVTWSPFGLGMPRVQVLSLKVKGNNDQYLLAGTHGRGAYWIPITSLDVEKNSAAQFTVGECHPNPVNAGSQQATQLTFTLDRSRPLEATLYDVLGHSVEVVANRSFAEGMHTIQIPTVGLPEGDYFVAIQTSGEALIRKISVVR